MKYGAVRKLCRVICQFFPSSRQIAWIHLFPCKGWFGNSKKDTFFPVGDFTPFWLHSGTQQWVGIAKMTINTLNVCKFLLARSKKKQNTSRPNWSTGPLVHWSTAPIMPLVHGARCYGVCVFLFTCILINLIFYFDQFNFLFCFQFSPFLLLFYFLLVNSFFFFLVQADTALICYLWAG